MEETNKHKYYVHRGTSTQGNGTNELWYTISQRWKTGGLEAL